MADAMPLSAGMLYHFNVIYNHAKSELGHTDDTCLSLDVTRWIVEALEGVGLVNSYYHDRDKRHNLPLALELERVLSQSEATLLVLTPGFIRNCFYQYNHLPAFVRLLDHAPDRLIVLRFGPEVEIRLPAELWGHDVIDYDTNDKELDDASFWDQLTTRLNSVLSLSRNDAVNDADSSNVFVEDSIFKSQEDCAVAKDLAKTSYYDLEELNAAQTYYTSDCFGGKTDSFYNIEGVEDLKSLADCRNVIDLNYHDNVLDLSLSHLSNLSALDPDDTGQVQDVREIIGRQFTTPFSPESTDTRELNSCDPGEDGREMTGRQLYILPLLPNPTDLSHLESYDVGQDLRETAHAQNIASLLDSILMTPMVHSQYSFSIPDASDEDDWSEIGTADFYDSQEDEAKGENDPDVQSMNSVRLFNDLNGILIVKDENIDPKSTRRKYQKKYEKLLYMDDLNANQNESDSSDQEETPRSSPPMSRDLANFRFVVGPQKIDTSGNVTQPNSSPRIHGNRTSLQTDVGMALVKELDAVDPDYGWQTHSENKRNFIQAELAKYYDHETSDGLELLDNDFEYHIPGASTCLKDKHDICSKCSSRIFVDSFYNDLYLNQSGNIFYDAESEVPDDGGYLYGAITKDSRLECESNDQRLSKLSGRMYRDSFSQLPSLTVLSLDERLTNSDISCLKERDKHSITASVLTEMLDVSTEEQNITLVAMSESRGPVRADNSDAQTTTVHSVNHFSTLDDFVVGQKGYDTNSPVLPCDRLYKPLLVLTNGNSSYENEPFNVPEEGLCVNHVSEDCQEIKEKCKDYESFKKNQDFDLHMSRLLYNDKRHEKGKETHCIQERNRNFSQETKYIRDVKVKSSQSSSERQEAIERTFHPHLRHNQKVMDPKFHENGRPNQLLEESIPIHACPPLANQPSSKKCNQNDRTQSCVSSKRNDVDAVYNADDLLQRYLSHRHTQQEHIQKVIQHNSSKKLESQREMNADIDVTFISHDNDKQMRLHQTEKKSAEEYSFIDDENFRSMERPMEIEDVFPLKNLSERQSMEEFRSCRTPTPERNAKHPDTPEQESSLANNKSNNWSPKYPEREANAPKSFKGANDEKLCIVGKGIPFYPEENYEIPQEGSSCQLESIERQPQHYSDSEEHYSRIEDCSCSNNFSAKREDLRDQLHVMENRLNSLSQDINAITEDIDHELDSLQDPTSQDLALSASTESSNIEAQGLRQNASTECSNVKTKDATQSMSTENRYLKTKTLAQNGPTKVNNIETQNLTEIVSTEIRNIEPQDLMQNVSSEIRNIEPQDLIQNVSSEIRNIEPKDLMQSVSTEISNIKSQDLKQNASAQINNIEPQDLMQNVPTEISNIETQGLMQNVSTEVSNIETEGLKQNMSTEISNIKSQGLKQNASAQINNIEPQDLMQNVSTEISNIETQVLMQNVSTEISNIETQVLMQNVSTEISNRETQGLMQNVSTEINNIETQKITQCVSTKVSNIEPQEGMQNTSTEIKNIEPQDFRHNESTEINTIETQNLMQNASTEINNIKTQNFAQNVSTEIKSIEPQDLTQNVSTKINTIEPQDLTQNVSTKINTIEPQDPSQNVSTKINTIEPQDPSQNVSTKINTIEPQDLTQNVSTEINYIETQDSRCESKNQKFPTESSDTTTGSCANSTGFDSASEKSQPEIQLTETQQLSQTSCPATKRQTITEKATGLSNTTDDSRIFGTRIENNEPVKSHVEAKAHASIPLQINPQRIDTMVSNGQVTNANNQHGRNETLKPSLSLEGKTHAVNTRDLEKDQQMSAQDDHQWLTFAESVIVGQSPLSDDNQSSWDDDTRDDDVPLDNSAVHSAVSSSIDLTKTEIVPDQNSFTSEKADQCMTTLESVESQMTVTYTHDSAADYSHPILSNSHPCNAALECQKNVAPENVLIDGDQPLFTGDTKGEQGRRPSNDPQKYQRSDAEEEMIPLGGGARSLSITEHNGISQVRTFLDDFIFKSQQDRFDSSSDNLVADVLSELITTDDTNMEMNYLIPERCHGIELVKGSEAILWSNGDHKLAERSQTSGDESEAHENRRNQNDPVHANRQQSSGNTSCEENKTLNNENEENTLSQNANAVLLGKRKDSESRDELKPSDSSRVYELEHAMFTSAEKIIPYVQYSNASDKDQNEEISSVTSDTNKSLTVNDENTTVVKHSSENTPVECANDFDVTRKESFSIMHVNTQGKIYPLKASVEMNTVLHTDDEGDLHVQPSNLPNDKDGVIQNSKSDSKPRKNSNGKDEEMCFSKVNVLDRPAKAPEESVNITAEIIREGTVGDSKEVTSSEISKDENVSPGQHRCACSRLMGGGEVEGTPPRNQRAICEQHLMTSNLDATPTSGSALVTDQLSTRQSCDSSQAQPKANSEQNTKSFKITTDLLNTKNLMQVQCVTTATLESDDDPSRGSCNSNNSNESLRNYNVSDKLIKTKLIDNFSKQESVSLHSELETGEDIHKSYLKSSVSQKQNLSHEDTNANHGNQSPSLVIENAPLGNDKNEYVFIDDQVFSKETFPTRLMRRSSLKDWKSVEQADETAPCKVHPSEWIGAEKILFQEELRCHRALVCGKASPGRLKDFPKPQQQTSPSKPPRPDDPHGQKEWTHAQILRKKRRGTNVDGLPSSSSSSSSSGEEELSDWVLPVCKGLCHGLSKPEMPYMG